MSKDRTLPEYHEHNRLPIPFMLSGSGAILFGEDPGAIIEDTMYESFYEDDEEKNLR